MNILNVIKIVCACSTISSSINITNIGCAYYNLIQVIYYNHAIKIEEKKWANHEIWQQFIIEEFIEKM